MFLSLHHRYTVKSLLRAFYKHPVTLNTAYYLTQIIPIDYLHQSIMIELWHSILSTMMFCFPFHKMHAYIPKCIIIVRFKKNRNYAMTYL